MHKQWGMSLDLKGHAYYLNSNMSCGCLAFCFIEATDSREISTLVYSAMFFLRVQLLTIKMVSEEVLTLRLTARFDIRHGRLTSLKHLLPLDSTARKTSKHVSYD